MTRTEETFGRRRRVRRRGARAFSGPAARRVVRAAAETDRPPHHRRRRRRRRASACSARRPTCRPAKRRGSRGSPRSRRPGRRTGAKLLSSFVVGQRRRRRSIFENRRSARRGARSRGPERFREAEREPGERAERAERVRSDDGRREGERGLEREKNESSRSKPSVAKTRVENLGWRLALTAMATDPAAFQKNGAVLFFDDELVVVWGSSTPSRERTCSCSRGTPGSPRARRRCGPRTRLSCGAWRAWEKRTRGPWRRRRRRRRCCKRRRRLVRFRCGFSVRPRCARRMHVVSGDLRGVGMKTRRHWNSFATSFFKEAEETARDLEPSASSAGGAPSPREAPLPPPPPPLARPPSP